MNYTLAIFDMDGTILYTLEDLANTLNHALSQFHYPLRTLEEVQSFVGNGIRKLIERGVPAGLTTEEIDQVHACFTEYYKEHCSDTTKPYDGILDLLNALRATGCKTAVVSNKADYAVQELCIKYFPGLFDAAIGEREGVRKKPYPDSVNEVLNILHTDKKDAVYIGDSEVDIQTAENAGMDSIIVDWGFRDHNFLTSQGAKTIVSTPEEIYQLIL